MERNKRLKNRLFILLLVVSNTLGNIFLALGMKAMPDFQPGAVLSYTAGFLSNAWIMGGLALMTIWMVAQLSMFTWADLSYVLPVTGSAYVLTAILSHFFLNEQISIARWGGIVLVSFGVLLVSETPPWTHSQPPPEEEP